MGGLNPIQDNQPAPKADNTYLEAGRLAWLRCESRGKFPCCSGACVLARTCLLSANFDIILQARLLSKVDYSQVRSLFGMIRRPGAQGRAATP